MARKKGDPRTGSRRPAAGEGDGAPVAPPATESPAPQAPRSINTADRDRRRPGVRRASHATQQQS